MDNAFSKLQKIELTTPELSTVYINGSIPSLKNITLKGNFETGSKGIMELEGMPPMEYELTHVKVFEEFWDKTATPFGNILFGHQIIDNNDGSVIIKHSVSLDSEDIQHLEFLKQVFSDVPDSIFILKKYLES